MQLINSNNFANTTMESENENALKDSIDSTVTTLQATLFPTSFGDKSYFSTFLIKPNQYDDDEEKICKIREIGSKESFPFNKDTVFTSQPARWPTECQVLDERVTHITYLAPTFEPYYSVSGTECQPKPTGDDCGIIVYQYTPISAVNYFTRSSVGGSKYLLSTNPCPEIDTLKFESRFECGNLARAIRITPCYYELHLRADLYTDRHMQWFYFRVSNMKKQFLYRFSITNCLKENSLYNEGMRPLMYSTKDSQLHQIGWRRCGQNVTYFCNDNVSPDEPEQQMTYTLSFTLDFPHDDDVVYLTHCYPYTYTDLQDYLSELSTHPVKSTFSNVRLLCKTLAGNNVYYVTVTSPAVPGELKKKRAVVLTARVHPGETPASWMMKGILDFLTSDSGPAKDLRDKFIFKIVPMLNPDGVIVGNNRCSLSAKDLNRQYRTVIRDAYPSIWYTKLLVRRLLEECGVALYCDLHAHSRKHNIFIYGCETRRGSDKRLQEQVFPLMLHKNTADKFSFESCQFRIQKAKEGTGRVVMWMMGIANSYTMEASFAGSTLGNRVDTHFSMVDYEQMGKSFCQTLLDFYDEEPRKEKLRVKIIERLVKEGSNADEPTNIRLSDYSSDDGDTSSSSSNEAGRDDIFATPMVPPPSPVIIKKIKTKPAQKAKVVSKSPPVLRKPLPICKATLRLSLSEKNSIESSSDSGEEIGRYKKVKTLHKRRKKKKTKKKQYTHPKEYSDSEILVKKPHSQRSISVCELSPTEKIKSHYSNRRSRTPQPKSIFRVFVDKKHNVAHQLAEVQARLFTLRNKLWFGIGNGDVPLSWGSKHFNENSKSASPQKKNKKHNKKKVSKDEKLDKKNKEKQQKMETKEKSKKKPNGQTAVEWSMNIDTLKIRKSKSLPDTSNIKLDWNPDEKKCANEVDKRDKKKKKKRCKTAKKPKN